MSKKASLSSSGSLASCLRFAAQVLLSPDTKTATPAPEALTKNDLAPIVIGAHKFGLQITKAASESRGELNPRTLLRQCRDLGDEKTKGMMDGIALADLTWDFQGDVDDTLEMELEDLLQRAWAGEHAICALFSVSAPDTTPGSEEHALVWVPAEGNASSESPKHSMLLYICPGRVKVVKTVGDLVRKMREEIKAIQGGDASYCVWTVVAATKADAHHQQSRPKESALTSVAPISGTLRAKESDICIEPAEIPLRQSVSAMTPPTKRDLANNDSVHSSEAFVEGTQRVSDSTPTSKGSIFCFGGAASTSNRVQRPKAVQTLRLMPQRGIVATELDGGRLIETNNDDRSALEEGEGGVPGYNEGTSAENQDEDGPHKFRLDPGPDGENMSRSLLSDKSQSVCAGWSMRPPIPVSRSSAIDRHHHPQEPISQLSRSVDSRRMMSAQQSSRGGQSSFEDSSQPQPLWSAPSFISAADAIKPIQSPDIGQPSEDEDPLHEQGRARRVREVVKTPPMHSIFVFNSDSNASNAERDRSIEFGGDDDDQEGHQARDPPETHDTFDTLACDTLASTCSLRVLPTGSSSPVRQSLKASASSATDDDQTSCVPNCPLPPQEVVKKSARDRVRSKLGARVWWELEYAAKCIEKEVEQPQQPRLDSILWPVSCEHQSRVRSCDKEQTFKPTTLPVKKREASSENSMQLSPKPVVDSVLEAIAEERSPANSRRELRHEPKDMPRPRSTCNSASNCPSGARGSTFHTRTCSGTDVVCKDFSAHKEQPTRAEVPSSLAVEASTPVCQQVSSSTTKTAWVTNAEASKASTPLPVGHTVRSGSASGLQHSVNQQASPTKVGWSTTYSNGPTTIINQALEYESRDALSTERDDKRTARSSRLHDGRGESDEEGEEEAASLAQWASARATYELHTDVHASSGDKPVETAHRFAMERSHREEDASIPFHLSGRVPIRAQPVRGVLRADDDVDTNDTSPMREQPATPLVETATLDEASAPQTASDTPTQLLRVRAPPTAMLATFIALDDDKGMTKTSKTELMTRMDRLNELRRKKLEQLHKAREQALQQQQHNKSHNQEKKTANAGKSMASLAATDRHPPLQLRVKRASNRQQLQNAIEFTLLAGQSNERERLAALDALAQSTADSFVVLLKSAKELKFRALYETRTDARDEARRIYAVVSSAYAPLQLPPSAVAQFFKYSSAKKQFLAVDTRSFTVATDACALAEHHLLKKTGKPTRLL